MLVGNLVHVVCRGFWFVLHASAALQSCCVQSVDMLGVMHSHNAGVSMQLSMTPQCMQGAVEAPARPRMPCTWSERHIPECHGRL